MKYNFKILRLLFLILFLIFNSCAVENFEENERSVDAGIKTRIVNFNEFKNNSKASNLINSLLTNQGTSNGTLNRIIQDPIRNFSFDTNDGLYLEYLNLHTYTFPIKRPVDNGKLENLVISLQNDGTYKVKLYVYNLTSQEKIDLELNKLNRIQNPVTSINIENFDTSFITESCEEITETIWVSCGSGNHNSSNLQDWHYCSSATKPRVYTRTRIKCITDSGGSEGGSGNSGGPPAGGSGGEPSEEPNFPTAQTPPEDYVLGISQPVKPKPTINNSPCDSIRSIITAQQGKVKNEINWLKTKVTGDSEFAVEVRKINNPDGTFQFDTTRSTDSQQFQASITLTEKSIGGLHNHPKRGNSIPSFQDLKWLLTCYETVTPGRKPYSFLMTICTGSNGNPQIYNTKINNISMLRDAVNSVWNNQKYASITDEKIRMKAILKDESLYYQGDPANLEKLFLQKYGSSGIDLYRSTDYDNLDWKKLELNSNPNSSTPVIANPC
jgi:hypothetical protein